MKEIYWNTQKDMLLMEDLNLGSVTRFDQLTRSYIVSLDKKIAENYPDQYEELCNIVGRVGAEYGRVYQFFACNSSVKDGNADIDEDFNFILERVSCPIRHTCKRTTCRAQVTGKLSDREIQVLGLMVKGFSEEEIAERLFISKSTVHNHTTHIYTKLGLTGVSNPDRVAAVYAVKNKLVD
jgi:DNA-binding CsgD family transcriptional regulator